jgi:hypothetical protein
MRFGSRLGRFFVGGHMFDNEKSLSDVNEMLRLLRFIPINIKGGYCGSMNFIGYSSAFRKNWVPRREAPEYLIFMHSEEGKIASVWAKRVNEYGTVLSGFNVGLGGEGSYQITDFSSPSLNKSLDKETGNMYTVDEIGEDFVVVNGERIEVDPPFEALPDKKEYETWLNGVMTDATEAIRGRADIQNFKDHLASVAQGRKAN